ncbi:hypothetical protein AMELA_G00065600 [Ameiurus melas]|uniref:Uncharacterized protein n=1 Tax=Ameiurus melas TaxID=219545 RepID=A0A7J6B5L8_AMEME|nr:hypothetical protein AMELA_G00065600 [Ameiurus melas]
MALDSAFVYSGAREGKGPCCCALLFISRINAANTHCSSICFSTLLVNAAVFTCCELCRSAERRSGLLSLIPYHQ